MRLASLSACSGVLLSVLCFTVREARAAGPSGAAESTVEPSPSSFAAGSRWALALGTGIALGMTDARESYDPESVAVGGVNLLGLDAAVRYRVLEALALGVRVGWATELADHEYSTRFGNGGLGRSGSLDRNLVQFAIEGRYQPGGSGLYAALRG